jgi:hypothetical protein
MQSSATVALRAFVMLACAVGIPVLAMSGASWTEIVKKFQNLRWPHIVEFASASTPAPATTSEPPRFDAQSPVAELQRPPVAPPTLAIQPVGHEAPIDAVQPAKALPDVDDIPKRLKDLGATYYVLESWGNDEQLYRFYCRMAVAGSSDYTQCFEATDANPQQAMQRVLRQVESWRETASHGS